MTTNLATEPTGFLLLFIFAVCYYFIAFEDKFHLNKAKPALFAGTLMFIVIGIHIAFTHGDPEIFHNNLEHIILEISEIFFFLFVAMTFIETLIERGAFASLQIFLTSKNYSHKQLFWITGGLAFILSPIADNLTTALILSTVLITIDNNKKFLIPSAISVVVAANAGGAWSPFGDITTLMAWSAGKAEFSQFLTLFPASLLGWLTTAFLLSLSIPKTTPPPVKIPDFKVKQGTNTIIFIGIFTIFFAVVGHQFLHIPAMWGMLFGLSILKLYSFHLTKRFQDDINIFACMSKIENDTLLFFFGILAAVGALHFAGYLLYVSDLYTKFDHTLVNIGVGFLSAIVDNVPVMSAILKANPTMELSQWLLVTLTAGIGGSLISFGSAAGVGVMGKMRGVYTVGSHFKYVHTVLAGYIVSIGIWYLQFKIF